MRIKYILLGKPLNLPGLGVGKKLSANGLDNTLVGCVKQIVATPLGYVIELPSGHHKGFYRIPMHAVEHEGLELTQEESDAMHGIVPVPVDAGAKPSKKIKLVT